MEARIQGRPRTPLRWSGGCTPESVSAMSEPSTLLPVSLSASGYEDGLGRRSLEIDRESGVMLERLHLRPEIGAFEAFLRERVAFSVSIEHAGFARVRSIERSEENTAQ